MTAIRATALPAASLLARGARPGDYLDCFEARMPRQVDLAEFIAAFYCTPLFRLERLVLALPLRRWVRDGEAAALAQGAERFAAWNVVGRDAGQILLEDRSGATRSWLCVDGARLLFGSGVRARDGRLSLPVRLFLPLHGIYARALLRAAVRRLRQ